MCKISDLTNENLFEQYYYLVEKIARFYSKYSQHLDDLLQEGSIGLIEAKMRYQEEKGASFPTYASYWIKNRILSVLDSEIKDNKNLEFDDNLETIDPNSEKSVSLPDEKLNLKYSLPQIEELILKKSFEEKKTLNAIAEEFGISREKARQYKQKAMRRYKSEVLKKNACHKEKE